MKTIIKPRQTGKTHDLIKLSAETGYHIITKDKHSCREIEKRAKEIGIEIPKPFNIYEIINTAKLRGKDILIDDADFVLSSLIRELTACTIDTITMIKRNELGHEVDINGNDITDMYSGSNDKSSDNDNIEVKDLTPKQIELLKNNNITNVSDYGYIGILTVNNISYINDNTAICGKNVTVKKYMQFKNIHTNTTVEIEVDLDNIINEFYS